MKIYTKTGDDGTTGLVGGSRVKKYNLRLETYGSVDELNSYTGLIRTKIKGNLADMILEKIQNRLFSIGAILATEDDLLYVHTKSACNIDDITLLEKEMDRMAAELPELRNFVLPGGSEVSALCHVARTVCRRAERRIVELSDQATVDALLIKYINRLSDYFFMLSRMLLFEENINEIIWQQD